MTFLMVKNNTVVSLLHTQCQGLRNFMTDFTVDVMITCFCYFKERLNKYLLHFGLGLYLYLFSSTLMCLFQNKYTEI